MGSKKFRERFWVLKNGELHYYKTGAQALGDKPTGTIKMSEVHEVRPSKDPASPDLALDIWTTAGRVFVVVPLNEEAKQKWQAVLTLALDENSDASIVAAAPKRRSHQTMASAVEAGAAEALIEAEMAVALAADASSR